LRQVIIDLVNAANRDGGPFAEPVEVDEDDIEAIKAIFGKRVAIMLLVEWLTRRFRRDGTVKPLYESRKSGRFADLKWLIKHDERLASIFVSGKDGVTFSPAIPESEQREIKAFARAHYRPLFISCVRR